MKTDSENKTSFRQKAIEMVAQMSLEEKVSLCSGKDCWNTKSIERLGIDSVMMSDGPHGLRKQIGVTDNLGIGESAPAVCFPTASALACSFDRELAYQVGKAIGEECAAEGVSIILGPGVNQKRSPLCGRNFEYFSEDPMVSGELAAGMINGVQSTGAGTSLKHFAVNNQEKRRMTINAILDERTLREAYLRAFEIAVKKGKPDTVMCAYNRVNGEYCSENRYLLTDILREELGFEGAVLSDWGAVNDRVSGIAAGLDIEMPGNNGYHDAKIIEAIQNKTLSEEELDKAACRATELILKGLAYKNDGYRCDRDAHHQLAVKAEEQSAVLLKNEEHTLPGNVKQKAAVIGAFAKIPRYQGTGSSKIHPIRVENPWDSFMDLGMDAVYAPGYLLSGKMADNGANKKRMKESTHERRDRQERLIKEACETARGRDIVYLFAGLPEGYESEGFDRKDMSLPEEQNRLIEAVSQCNPNVVVILIGGAPMELPWISKVKAVLMAYLGGEGVGRAVVNLLLGCSVPSGKLAETWPLSLRDTPCYHYFPGGRLTVEHRESIYVGYRYYEKANKPVLFPFGHGLSYTDFEYSDLRLDREACDFGDSLQLTFHITNKGKVPAKETAFIFVAYENKIAFLPKKELREFVKIELNPGETKEVIVSLDTGTFGYYNTLIKDWYCESGTYQILAGSSSDACFLETAIDIRSQKRPQPDLRESAPIYYQLPNEELIIPKQEFEALYGTKLPISEGRASRPYGFSNTLEDIGHTLVGKIILIYAKKVAKEVTECEKEQEGMLLSMFQEMPFFSMAASDDQFISESFLEGILNLLNGHYIKGVKKLLK